MDEDEKTKLFIKLKVEDKFIEIPVTEFHFQIKPMEEEWDEVIGDGETTIQRFTGEPPSISFTYEGTADDLLKQFVDRQIFIDKVLEVENDNKETGN